MYSAGIVNTAPATTGPATPPMPVMITFSSNVERRRIETSQANREDRNRNSRFHHLPDLQAGVGGSDCEDDAEEDTPADGARCELGQLYVGGHNRRVRLAGLQWLIRAFGEGFGIEFGHLRVRLLNGHAKRQPRGRSRNSASFGSSAFKTRAPQGRRSHHFGWRAAAPFPLETASHYHQSIELQGVSGFVL